MYFERKCKITYVASGATIYSEDGRLCDTENFPPLSDNGVEEVEKACEILKKRRIRNDKIISSAGIRAVQSSKIVSKLFKQEFIVERDLSPRKCGSFNGKTLSQIELSNPEDFSKLMNNPEISVPDDAESICNYLDRISNVIDRLVEENVGMRLIVVTYPEVIQAAVAKALNVPPKEIKNIYIKSGSLTQISYYDAFESLIYCGYKDI